MITTDIRLPRNGCLSIYRMLPTSLRIQVAARLDCWELISNVGLRM
jgi:hypothetical protein